MSGIRRRLPPPWVTLRQRLYRRRAAKVTGSSRFAAMGEGSIVHPPALIIGHHRIHLGDDVVVHPRAFFSVVDEHEGKHYESRLVIGDHVRMGADMVIACCGSIEIADDVLTADRVFIGDTYHEYRDVSRPIRHQGLHDPRPVRIGRGAFLGINCAVLPGVSVGEGAYVGANAVVTQDVPPHSLAVGNPARIVRHWNGDAWVRVPAEP